MAQQNSQIRTYARNRNVNRDPSFSRKGREKIFEGDSVYFLKLVLCVILATLWVKFSTPIVIANIPLYGLPLGMLAGFILVRLFEKYQQNRKIWYAVLVIVTVICYFVPAGVVI